MRLKGVTLPRNKQKDAEFVSKNKYKEYHPSDLFNYFSILEEVIDQEID